MIFRNLFRGSPPLIPEAEALQIAQRLCQEREWAWLEPIKITLTRRGWFIHTNWQSRGLNARILINQETGEVITAQFWPR